MKTHLTIIALVVAALAAPLLAQGGATRTEGKFVIGITGDDLDRYIGRAAEYEIADQGVRPWVKAYLELLKRDLYLEMVAAHSGNPDDQFYRVHVNAARVWDSQFTYRRFLHRLDHDPLANIDTTQVAGHLYTYADDLAPAHDYRITYSEIAFLNEFRIPQAEWLSLRFDYNRQQREGAHQSTQLNHCSSCHVTGQVRPVDEAQDDFQFGIAVDTAKAGGSYTFQYRRFSDSAGSLPYLFDEAVHPGTRLDVFTNRILYDRTDGEIPISQVPDTNKMLHALKAYYNIDDRNKVTGAFLYSEVENESSDLKIYSRNYTGRYTGSLGRGVTVNARFRYSNLDNATTYVELPDQVANAGPQAGRTYAEAYPTFGGASFTRYSALSRENTEFDADLSVPLPGRNRFVAEYDFEDTARDYFETGSTREHQLTFTFRTDHRRELSGWARYQASFIDNPFANQKAAVEEVLQPYSTPGAVPFPGVQYFQLYASRQATLTNQPTMAHDLKLSGTWKPIRNGGLNVAYNLKHSTNDELNFSDWSQTVHTIGADAWYAPDEKITLNAGIHYTDYETESLFVQPVWNG